jgi:FKBP-type peptidyl-prolyl cis-trans isomerase 2
MKVENNKQVSMHYELKLDSGEVVDTSEGREPLTFIYGRGQLIPGLERELQGLSPGDTKQVVVAAEDAYGPVDLEAIRPIPLEHFPEDLKLEKGLVLVMTDEHGNEVPFKITELTESEAIADFNHPLAGKDLHFSITIVDVTEA